MENGTPDVGIERIEAEVVRKADCIYRLSHSLETVEDIGEFIAGLTGLIEQASVLKHMRSKLSCTPHLVHSTAEAS